MNSIAFHIAEVTYAFRNVVEKGLSYPRPAATPGCWKIEVGIYLIRKSDIS